LDLILSLLTSKLLLAKVEYHLSMSMILIYTMQSRHPWVSSKILEQAMMTYQDGTKPKITRLSASKRLHLQVRLLSLHLLSDVADNFSHKNNQSLDLND
jgi:hypothetical protein